MLRARSHFGFVFVLCLASRGNLPAADTVKPGDAKPALPDLAGYRTVDTAVTTTIRPFRTDAAPAAQPGYLGVYVTADEQGQLVLAEVAADSPAIKAGLRRGDRLVRLEGQELAGAESFRELLRARAAGEKIKLAVVRDGKPVEVIATLTTPSRPMQATLQRAALGVRVGEPKDRDGVPIEQV